MDESFYREMLAEAEAEMTALEGSLDTFSEMTMDEDPPQKLISFANEVRRTTRSTRPTPVPGKSQSCFVTDQLTKGQPKNG